MLFGVCVADDLFQSIPLESSPVQSSPAIVDGRHNMSKILKVVGKVLLCISTDKVIHMQVTLARSPLT